MQTKILFYLFCVVILHNATIAQQVQKQNLYTLKSDEHLVFSNEHQLRITPSGADYVLYIQHNTPTDTFFFAKHANKVSPNYQRIYYPEQTNFQHTNGYYFVGERSGLKYVYANDQEFGPFTEINPQGNSAYHLEVANDGQIVFAGQTDETWHIYHGKKTYPVYQPTTYRFNKFDISNLPNSKIAYSSIKDNKTVLHLEGKEVGVFDKIMDYSINPEGKYAVYFKNGDDYYLKTNTKLLGPWTQPGYSQIGKNATYCITYKQDQVWYAVTNNGNYGPYEKISEYYGVKLNEQGNFWFSYLKGNQWYVFFNGKEYPSGDDYSAKCYSNPNNLAIRFVKNNEQYIQINGKKYGPYQKPEWTDNPDLYEPILGDKGVFAFVFKRNDLNGINVNGKESPLYDAVSKPNIQNQIISYRFHKQNTSYLFVNGREYGPFTNFKRGYNPINTTVTGSFAEIVQDGTQWKLATPQGLSQPYADIYDIQLSPDGTFAYTVLDTLSQLTQLILNTKVVAQEKKISNLTYVSPNLYFFHSDTDLCVNGVNYGNAEIKLSTKNSDYVIVSDQGAWHNHQQISTSPGYLLTYSKSLNNFFWLSLDENNITINQLKVH